MVDEWWVERWFALLDEAELPVECIGLGLPAAGSLCPLCREHGRTTRHGDPVVMSVRWDEATHEIAFVCELGCDEELIASSLGAID
jgi:hypothetical protein